jgi:hypothetical protein
MVDPNSKEAQIALKRIRKEIESRNQTNSPLLVPKSRKVTPVIFGNIPAMNESMAMEEEARTGGEGREEEKNEEEIISSNKSRARAASEISDMIYPSPVSHSPRLHPVVNVAIASINEHSRSIDSVSECQDIQKRVGLQVDTSPSSEDLLCKQIVTGRPPHSKQCSDIASILHQDYLSWKDERSDNPSPRYGYLVSFQWWNNWMKTVTENVTPSMTPVPPPYPTLAYDGEGFQESIAMSPRRAHVLNSSQSMEEIGPINNTSLSSSSPWYGLDGLSYLRVDDDSLSLISSPPPHSSQEYDFVFVPPQVWLALHHWYGGSPEFFVQVNPQPRKASSNGSLGLMELSSGHCHLTSLEDMKKIQLNPRAQAKEKEESSPLVVSHYCHVCRDLGNLRCSKCKTLYYCSQKCQFSDWPFHKLSCHQSVNVPPSLPSSASSTHVSAEEPLSNFLSPFNWTKKITGGGSGSQNNSNSISSFKRTQCRGLVGLANLGNSCYLNASIQCLAHTFPLVSYLISSRYQGDINTTSVDSTRGKFVTEFSSLVKEMWLKPYPSPVLQPIPFRRLLGRLNSDYSTFQQQDAHDVLVYLLDRLHEDVNKVMKKPYVENSEGNGEDDEKISKESWEKHKLREESYIQEVIGCQLRSQLICPAHECQKKSVSFEFASTIQLAIPNRNRDRDRTRSNSAGLFQYKDPSATGTTSLTIPITFIPEVSSDHLFVFISVCLTLSFFIRFQQIFVESMNHMDSLSYLTSSNILSK